MTRARRTSRRSDLSSRAKKHLARGAPALAAVLAVALPVVGYVLGWQWLAARAAADPAARLAEAPAPIAIAEAPPWLRPADVRAIHLIGSDEREASLYDPQMTRRLAERYTANPWVRRVDYVRRRFPDRVDVSITVRRPVALVETAGRRFALDADGVRLPTIRAGAWARGSGPGRPLIVGLESGTPTPEPGERWSDPRVGRALDLCAALAARFELSDQELRIVLGRRGRGAAAREDYVIEWAGASYHWGSFHPQEETPFGLLSTSDKLDNLAIARRAAQADARIRRVRLDARQGEPAVEPVTSDQ